MLEIFSATDEPLQYKVLYSLAEGHLIRVAEECDGNKTVREMQSIRLGNKVGGRERHDAYDGSLELVDKSIKAVISNGIQNHEIELALGVFSQLFEVLLLVDFGADLHQIGIQCGQP